MLKGGILMSEIKSDMSKTYHAYYIINNATQSCSSISEPGKDESTTVSGNKNAHTAIEQLLTINTSITAALEKANTTLKEVGDSFEAMDLTLGNQISK